MHQTHDDHILLIKQQGDMLELALKMQQQITRNLDHMLVGEVKSLMKLDDRLRALFLECKKTEVYGPSLTHYVWRTQEDGKVRPDHAAHHGKVFAWNDPPSTGHPGKGYNCCCIAEPYVEGKTEYANQTLVSVMNDNPKKWRNRDFWNHFQEGSAHPLTLSKTGHLQGVINWYAYKLNTYQRVNQQVIDAARKQEEGYFEYDFKDTYGFIEYVFCFGKSVVSGVFKGNVERVGSRLHIVGKIFYYYSDVFTDPLDLRQIASGTSTPNENTDGHWTEFGGVYYDIKDSWETHYEAEVESENDKSHYQKMDD